MVSMSVTMSVLCDERALTLLKAIVLSQNDYGDILITKLKLTRRQYYSIMGKLMHAGVVRRISGKYSLTSLGKIVFTVYGKIETAVKYYWKLKAVDSIIMSANAELPIEECHRIVDKLIDNVEIKEILFSKNNICESSYARSSDQDYQEQQQRQQRQYSQPKQERHSHGIKDLIVH